MSQIRFLSGAQTRGLLKMNEVIAAVEGVYRAKAQKQVCVWPLVCHEFEPGVADMDIKSGCINTQGIHGLKMVNWFSKNAQKGLPDLSGIVMVSDSTTGMPLGILEGGYITCMRTGAAGAIGAKALARKDAENLMILGAGGQAPYQIAASLLLLPQIKTVRIADPLSAERAKQFAASIAARLSEELGVDAAGIEFIGCSTVEEGVRSSDIIITVTPARTPLIRAEWVKQGTHFSCIGADMPGKEEIDPEIFRGARVFGDDRTQCFDVGECELAHKSGCLAEDGFLGEIGQVLTGQIEGRLRAEDITIFDATGMALLDLAAAKLALDEAQVQQVGTVVEL